MSVEKSSSLISIINFKSIFHAKVLDVQLNIIGVHILRVEYVLIMLGEVG